MEALPGVQEEMERAERTAPVIRVARNVAYGSLDDEKVKAMLCERPEAEPKVVDEALTHFRWRDDYIGDCTYRLLAAAASATTVASILPERAELFMQEESIGSVPIEQALQRLAEIEPRLLDVKQEAHALDAGKDAQGVVCQSIFASRWADSWEAGRAVITSCCIRASPQASCTSTWSS